MIRKTAMFVMIVSLLVLSGQLFFGKPLLVGNAVAMACDDSDLKEENDPLNGNIFPRSVYCTLNYNLPGTARGYHSLWKTPVTMKDNCISPSLLREYYCDVKNNVVLSSTVDCPTDSRCAQGACVLLLCEDEDDFDPARNSTVRYTSASGSKVLTADDYCESSTTLVEFICQKTNVGWPGGIQNSYDYPDDLRRAVHHTCPPGTECLKGACVEK